MPSAPRERLIEHALALLVESEIAPPEAAADARTALQRWRARSAEHEIAAQEAHRRWDALEGMTADLREHFGVAPRQVASPLARTSARPRARRKVLLSVAALLGVGLVAGKTALSRWRQPVFVASHKTRIAQTADVALPDGPGSSEGSLLSMGASSALDVTLYRHGRVVELRNGEVRFDVSPDRQRPFIVLTRQARIEVVGTVFTVSDRGRAITIGVEHGHVRVQARHTPATPGRPDEEALAAGLGPIFSLKGGQMVDVREGHVGRPRQADATALSAWRDGWLVFDNVPLGEALATVNAYRARPIIAMDDRVNAMRLTGRFPARDSDSLLAVLPTILPLGTNPLTDGRVELRAR